MSEFLYYWGLNAKSMIHVNINAKAHNRTIRYLAIITIGFIIMIYVRFNSLLREPNILAFLTIYLFVLFLLPAFYLYIEYLFYNYKLNIYINDEKIIIDNGKCKRSYSLNQIKSFIKICSRAEMEGDIKWNASDEFFYYEIEFNSGERIFISALMSRRLEIPSVYMEIKKVFIPSIYYGKKYLNKAK